MRIVADHDRCEGLGMCEAMAHTFFEVSDDDQVVVLDDSPVGDDVKHVRAAVASCPVSALTLVE